jgi:hypothetical protein
MEYKIQKIQSAEFKRRRDMLTEFGYKNYVPRPRLSNGTPLYYQKYFTIRSFYFLTKISARKLKITIK